MQADLDYLLEYYSSRSDDALLCSYRTTPSKGLEAEA